MDETNKALLRQSLRLKRQSLSLEQQQQKAQQLVKHLENLSFYQNAQSIAAYWPNDAEISPLPLLENAFAHHKTCYLPRVEHNTLVFTQYCPNDPLVPNRYSILEPESSQPSIPITQLDLILVPLVAFDEQAHRLGMGKGYYDRTLSPIKSLAKPHRIGLAYAFQKVDAIPTETWDICLEGIITDIGYQGARQ